MLLVLLSFYLLRNIIQAAPITAADTSDFILSACDSRPLAFVRKRSTWEIAWSCLATTLACTWLSVHPNIPAPNEEWYWIMWRKLKAMIWALFSPELMIMWAMRQRKGAQKIRKSYQSYGWTDTHGHFLQMGGFLSCNKDGTIERPILFSADEIIEFPIITRDEIMDRSKQDLFAKGLALLQIIWFVAQCIARIAYNLAITEMELTTVALAVLNLGMYFLWWQKPFDIRCPIMVYVKDHKATLLAAGENKAPFPPGSESKSMLLTIFRSIALTVREDIHDNGWLCTLFDVLFNWPLIEPFLELTDTPRGGWHTAAIKLGAKRVSIFYNNYHSGLPEKDYPPTALTTIAGLIFGGTHIAGWYFVFPSPTEQILWRTASIGVTGVPFIICIGRLIVRGYILRRGDANLNGIKRAFEILEYICIILYLVFRLFLFVEGGISLRALPPTADESIKWIENIPHIR